MISARVDGRRVDLPPPDRVRAWKPDQGLLWLDVAAPTEEDLDWVGHALHPHPLVMEDLRHRNQRPKVDEYPAMLFVVLFGAAGGGGPQEELQLAEVHVLVADAWIATVSDVEIAAMRRLLGACEVRPELGRGGPAHVFHRICDALVDSMFPVLDEIDEDIDRIEDDIVRRADETTVGDIFRLKRELNQLRRVLGPQRDLLQALSGPRVPRLDAEAQLYLRDVYDHAVRMVEQIDSYRDIVTGALDVYLSSVSNRLGEQTRRLTIVATIFLPLTFLTGFFGMNFGVLVASISTVAAFAAGIGAMAVSVPVVYWASQRFTARVRPIPPALDARRPRRRPYTRLARRRAAHSAQGGPEGSA